MGEGVCIVIILLVIFSEYLQFFIVKEKAASLVVFKAILYSFASGKTMPAGIDTDAISAAFAYPRKRGLAKFFSRN